MITDLPKASASMTMDDLKSDKNYSELAKKDFAKDVLSEWEAEATKNIPYQTIYAQNERILALIDLVRKKDEALRNCSRFIQMAKLQHAQQYNSFVGGNLHFDPTKEALALTSDLSDDLRSDK